MGEMQGFEELDDSDFSPFSEGFLASITDNLRLDPRLKEWVMEVLDTPPTAGSYSSMRESAAVCLAGDLRLEQAVPLLVRRMHRYQDLFHYDLEIALAEIRTDSVVSEFHRRLPWAGTTFCQTAINALADTYTPLSQATLRCWLELFRQSSEALRREEEEADEDLDAWESLATIDTHVNRVLAGMVRQLMRDGVAEAQAFIEQGKADVELCEMTIAASTILNLDFPARDLAETIIKIDADEYPDDVDEYPDDEDEYPEDDGDEEDDWDEEDAEVDKWLPETASRSFAPLVFEEDPPANQPFRKATARVGRNCAVPVWQRQEVQELLHEDVSWPGVEQRGLRPQPSFVASFASAQK